MYKVIRPSAWGCVSVPGSVNQNQKIMETTNDLRYSITKIKGNNEITINIRLNDECKNGHNDFSITGDIWTKGEPHTDRNCQGGGVIGDEIAKLWPEFKIFNDLHLCDAKGAPMYAEANGFYHLKQSTKDVAMNYLRIDENEYNALVIAEDQDHFNYILNNILGIPARWEREAADAILELEKLTGQKFEDDSRRYQFTPLTAEKSAEIKARIETGYYSTENLNERDRAKNAAIKEKLIAGITADRDKAVAKAQGEYDVKMYILNDGLPLDNFIYYTHSNKAVFNWKDYDKKISREQFDAFINNLDAAKLPKDIVFTFGEK